jgi:hypothetical protein
MRGPISNDLNSEIKAQQGRLRIYARVSGLHLL